MIATMQTIPSKSAYPSQLASAELAELNADADRFYVSVFLTQQAAQARVITTATLEAEYQRLSYLFRMFTVLIEAVDRFGWMCSIERKKLNKRMSVIRKMLLSIKKRLPTNSVL